MAIARRVIDKHGWRKGWFDNERFVDEGEKNLLKICHGENMGYMRVSRLTMG